MPHAPLHGFQTCSHVKLASQTWTQAVSCLAFARCRENTRQCGWSHWTRWHSKGIGCSRDRCYKILTWTKNGVEGEVPGKFIIQVIGTGDARCPIVTRSDNTLAGGICAFHKVSHLIIERERSRLPLLKLQMSLVCSVRSVSYIAQQHSKRWIGHLP